MTMVVPMIQSIPHKELCIIYCGENSVGSLRFAREISDNGGPNDTKYTTQRANTPSSTPFHGTHDSHVLCDISDGDVFSFCSILLTLIINYNPCMKRRTYFAPLSLSTLISSLVNKRPSGVILFYVLQVV